MVKHSCFSQSGNSSVFDFFFAKILHKYQLQNRFLSNIFKFSHLMIILRMTENQKGFTPVNQNIFYNFSFLNWNGFYLKYQFSIQ